MVFVKPLFNLTVIRTFPTFLAVILPFLTIATFELLLVHAATLSPLLKPVTLTVKACLTFNGSVPATTLSLAVGLSFAIGSICFAFLQTVQFLSLVPVVTAVAFLVTVHALYLCPSAGILVFFNASFG